MTFSSLVRRETSDEKGRHLVATERIPAGRLIFCERPMVSLQSTGNVFGGALVCHYCCTFVGTPEQCLAVASDPSVLQHIATDQQSAQRSGNDALIPCRHSCGTFYCSINCMQDDWHSGGHKELCTGCITDAEHPLIKFKKHAIENNEIFLLIAKWLVRIQKAKIPYNENEELNTHPLVDFSMNPWWKVATLPMQKNPNLAADALELEDSCKRLCRESSELLVAAWQQCEHEVSDWLAPEAIGRLIGSLEQNSMGIRRKHPIRRAVMEDQELRENFNNEIIACLEGAGMLGDAQEEEEEGISDGSEEGVAKGSQVDVEQPKLEGDEEGPVDLATISEQYSYSSDEIADFLANMDLQLSIGSDDDWDSIFQPMDGTAHFCFAEKMNHSCEPNVVLLYKSRGWGENHPLVAYCVALRHVRPGEELTIGYVTTDSPYEERKKALENYGFVCSCTKCQRQMNGIPEEHKDSHEMEDFEDDLFGSDGEGDTDTNELLTQLDGVLECDAMHREEAGSGGFHGSGHEKLQNMAEKHESVWNRSLYAAIPLHYLAPISSHIVNLLSALRIDSSVWAISMREDLKSCQTGIQNRDFSLCRLVGMELEQKLVKDLVSSGSFRNTEHRTAYWCACATAAVGFAHECSFLIAMQYIDKAIILGQPRDSYGDFFFYVCLYASQMAKTPCPHAIMESVPNYTEKSMMERVYSDGLSKPIRYPVEVCESICDMGEEFFKGLSQPLVLRSLARNWPATTKWRSLERLSHSYGHRVVPIEVGSMYDAMREEFCNIRTFISKYLAPSSRRRIWTLEDAARTSSSGSEVVETEENEETNIAYLAQHPLLDQIPELFDDVEAQPAGVKPTVVNAWVGTGGTRTPLHFDSYDNLLVQVVGAKYVRMYDPRYTESLYVISKTSSEDSLGRQGNMSALCCEREDFNEHPFAKDVPYTETILLPGDCLYIPSRYWHYVRSLSTSVSVNYWF